MKKQKPRYEVKELGKKRNDVYDLNNMVHFNNVVELTIPYFKLSRDDAFKTTAALEKYLLYFGGRIDKSSTRKVSVSLPPFWRAFKTYDRMNKETNIVIYDIEMLPRIAIGKHFPEVIRVHQSVNYYINKDPKTNSYIAVITHKNNIVHQIKGKGLADYILGKKQSDDKMEYDFLEVAARDYLNSKYPNWDDVFTYWN